MMAKTKREQRVSRAMTKGLVGVLLITGLGLGVGVYARASGSDFWSGAQSGLMMVLPWAVFAMLYRGYRNMDEYGKISFLRASTVAFASVMLFVMSYFPLEQALKWPPLPLWILWVLGWAVYGLTTAVLSRSRGQ